MAHLDPFNSLIYLLNIVIFYSYVGLPEGMGYTMVCCKSNIHFRENKFIVDFIFPFLFSTPLRY